jgi:hypothetical protein
METLNSLRFFTDVIIFFEKNCPKINDTIIPIAQLLEVRWEVYCGSDGKQ